ncbi:MAG: hypothetical protein ACOX17_00045 [Christensenellales bacterium]
MVRYQLWGRFWRAFLRFFMPRYKCIGFQPPDVPVIYVSRHFKRGTVGAMVQIDLYPRPWVLDVLIESRTCTRHMRNYTLTKRIGMPKWLAWPIGWILGQVIGKTLRSVGAIPVHRGKREIIHTFNQSVEVLDSGASVIIFPDVDVLDDSPYTGELYEGFVLLARRAWKKTKKNFPFVPIYTSSRSRTILAGEPIYMDMERPVEEEQQRIVALLQEELNHMALACGDLLPGREKTECPE